MSDQETAAPSREDEHYPCPTRDHCEVYPWHAAFDVLGDTVAEEADHLRRLVDDEDSSCPARKLRRERLAALEWVLALHDELRRWEW